MDNSIILKGSIDSNMLFDFREKLSSINSIITVIIHSTGGDLDCAFSIYDLIKECKENVTTIILGKCCSAALVLFLAGNIRKMYKNSFVLIHEPFVTFPDDKPFTLSDIVYEYERLYWRKEKLLNLIQESTNISKEEITKKFFSAPNTILTAEDCIKYSLATNII